jgi:hypothetical protein
MKRACRHSYGKTQYRKQLKIGFSARLTTVLKEADSLLRLLREFKAVSLIEVAMQLIKLDAISARLVT